MPSSRSLVELQESGQDWGFVGAHLGLHRYQAECQKPAMIRTVLRELQSQSRGFCNVGGLHGLHQYLEGHPVPSLTMPALHELSLIGEVQTPHGVDLHRDRAHGFRAVVSGSVSWKMTA